jgi:LysR family transcriptional regulator, regulator of abg operon
MSASVSFERTPGPVFGKLKYSDAAITSGYTQMDTINHVVRRMRFSHLQMLVELERNGSVSAAAEALHLSQPAVSKALGEVERALGFELFTRGAKGLKPSQKGEIVLRGATVLLKELGHVVNDAQQAGPEARSTVRLGGVRYTAQALAPLLLRRMAKGSGAWQFEIVEHDATELLDAVLRGDLDAALIGYSAISGRGNQRLRYDKLSEERFVVVAAAAHPLARRRRVTWAELIAEPWILQNPGSFLRQAIETRFVAEGIPAPAPWIVSNSPATNLNLVAQGLGIASVPASMVGDAERAGRVVRVRVLPEIEPAAVAIVYRDGTQDQPRIAALREAARMMGGAD